MTLQTLFKKILHLSVLLFGITLISFFVVHLVPGSPVDAKAEMNPKMTAQAKEKLTRLYGLDRPLPIQYADWVRKVLRLDFGDSFTDGQKVSAKISSALGVTLLINFIVFILVLGAGIPLGVCGAVRRGTRIDQWIGVFSFAAYAIPTFWLALLLMSFFGVTLRWLPVSGIHSIFYEHLDPLNKLADLAAHLVLPVAVASLAGIAAISRYMRSSMIAALEAPYIRTARAKGLSDREVVWKHALRNALLPLITIIGLWIPGLFGGSVVFETIFSIPGMGRLFYQSVFARDYPVIMGVLVLGSVLTLVANQAADVLYGLVDPRIRRERVR